MSQFLWALLLSLYVLGILFVTRLPYQWMVERGMEPIRAVYYNRKIIHMAAGGVGALVVPLIFTSPLLPSIAGLLLTILTWEAHQTSLRFYWFQTEENRNDVTFTLMWALSIAVLWWLLGDPWLAILPALYMAFGDGVTGIVRNALIGGRSKNPVGNVFMLLLCAPLGFVVGLHAQPAIPFWGILSAMAATFVERFEFGPIDDNVLITLVASLVLVAGVWLGPLP